MDGVIVGSAIAGGIVGGIASVYDGVRSNERTVARANAQLSNVASTAGINTKALVDIAEINKAEATARAQSDVDFLTGSAKIKTDILQNKYKIAASSAAQEVQMVNDMQMVALDILQMEALTTKGKAVAQLASSGASGASRLRAINTIMTANEINQVVKATEFANQRSKMRLALEGKASETGMSLYETIATTAVNKQRLKENLGSQLKSITDSTNSNIAKTRAIAQTTSSLIQKEAETALLSNTDLSVAFFSGMFGGASGGANLGRTFS